MTPQPQSAKSRRRVYLILLLILVPVLFFLGWSQAALNLSFIRPENGQATLFLLAVSAFIFVAFVIFAFILLRILLKLYVERRQQQLGAQFRTRMIAALLMLSLVPVSVLFIFAYGLLNRSIDRWFGIPLDLLSRDASTIAEQLSLQGQQRVSDEAGHLAGDLDVRRALGTNDHAALRRALEARAEALHLGDALCLDANGAVLARAHDAGPRDSEIAALLPGIARGQIPPEGASANWRAPQAGHAEWLLAARPLADSTGKAQATVVAVWQVPPRLQQVADQIQQEAQRYENLRRQEKAIKRIDLSILGLLTLLILFAATWLAMFLSKQVTVPIQALVEATSEVSKGNLGVQVEAQAPGELGTLIRSFNQMTGQLEESRTALEQAAKMLRQANQALEERSNTMEAILENIPTGVISLSPEGEIARVNATVERMFLGKDAKAARRLTDLLSSEDARFIGLLLRRAQRQGALTRQMELDLGSRRAPVALTVSSVSARHGSVGSVVVIEDLTDLLRAQKSAAWREVAQRLAHEIKNPLTPIQLSTERIRRLIERAGAGGPSAEVAAAVEESAALVGREVANLKALVDEFSAFARFPVSQPVLANLNSVVEEALNVFNGRLDGIVVHREFAGALPAVQVDPEQMKRAVVNLVDNAAEALEHSLVKEISVRTALDLDRDVVELEVADSGPGISPENKARLFLPNFSTKGRGTGLGLAIVSRIVSEHKGYIRVEDNEPTGARFVIELPAERAGIPSSTKPMS